MPGWLWIILAVLLLLGGTFFIFARIAVIRANEARSEILQRGDVVKAWIVRRVPVEAWKMDRVVVVVSPDPQADEIRMRQIVQRARAENEVVSESRTRLPSESTGGLEAYSQCLVLSEDQLLDLPEGGLENEWFNVRLLWGKHEHIVLIEPA